MAAVFNVFFDFGGVDGNAATNQNIDALGPPRLRFKQADDANIDLNDPMVIVAAATKYSKWKHLYLKCATAPDTQVDNVRFYTDGGGFGTGITVEVGNQFPTNNSSAPESGYELSDGNDEADLVTNHTGISSIADAFSKTEGSPLAGPSISETSNIIDTIGHMTDYLLLQMKVIDTASPGDLADETFTFKYDEI